MRFLKMSLIVAIVLAVFQPAVLAHVGSAVSTTLSNAATQVLTPAQAAPGTDYKDQEARRVACKLFRHWRKADEQTRERATATIAEIANATKDRTEDPAAKALLAVVPAAVGYGSGVPARSAQMLLRRECR